MNHAKIKFNIQHNVFIFFCYLLLFFFYSMSIFSKFIIPKLNIEFFFFLLSFFWEKFTNHWNRYEKDGVFFSFFSPSQHYFHSLFDSFQLKFYTFFFSTIFNTDLNSKFHAVVVCEMILVPFKFDSFFILQKKMFIHVVFMCVSVWKKTNDKFIRFTLQQRQQQQQQTRNSSEKKKTNIFIQFEFFCCHHHQRIFFLLEKDTWSNW